MRHLKASLLCAFVLLGGAAAGAPQATSQAPPGTDIYLVDIRWRGGAIVAGEPRNITHRPGYDNQPGFTPDGKSILYTSIREDKQADIYRYNVESGTTTRFTQTPESEYSPTVTPDGKYVSVIRVEADQAQRLWEFPIAGGAPRLVLEHVKPVGYHVWADAKTLVLFVLGEPNTLQVADAATGKAETITTNIGRSLLRIPRQNKVSFVQREAADRMVVKSLDLKSRKITPITRLLAGNEYFVWTPAGAMLMAKDARLLLYDPARDKDWREVADFSKVGIGGITRLALSPRGDKLALVASDK